MIKKTIKISIPFIVTLSIFTLSITFFFKKETKDLKIIKGIEGDIRNYAIYTEEGDIIYTDSSIDIESTLTNNIVINIDDFKIKNPIGIIENPPDISITDIKNMTLESLDNDSKVLIIYIDGLGYDLYEKAIENNYLPYISSLEKGKKALTVYPSITDVAFASMVTGVTPKYTGIHGREKTLLTVDTIFDIAYQKGKTSKVIEGNIRIINDEVETILNIDDNENGTIDDEIFKSAIDEINNPSDILLIHFHSYDDFGHEFGPSSEEALEQLKIIDSYVKDISKNYKGDIIIVSDHGMHNVGDGGEHGNFSPLDMFIPIILDKNN